MSNLFIEARDIIRQKGMVDLNQSEFETVGAAMIVVNHPAYPYPDGLPVGEALTRLGKLLDNEDGRCRKSK